VTTFTFTLFPMSLYFVLMDVEVGQANEEWASSTKQKSRRSSSGVK
jgi:hypothetical protein